MITWLGSALVLLGTGLVLVGGVGLLRLPDLYSRLHAAGVTETLGAGLVILGLMLHAGLDQALVKLVFIGVFLLVTGPVATHAIARAARSSGLPPMVESVEHPGAGADLAGAGAGAGAGTGRGRAKHRRIAD